MIKFAFVQISALWMVVLLCSSWWNVKVVNAQSIGEIAAGDDRFTTLVAALGAANLVTTLDEAEGPLTVFAPTNEAFEKLPPGTVDELLMEENLDMLENILLFHVAEGRYTSRRLAREKKQRVRMLNGDRLKVTRYRSDIYLNDCESRVIIADIEADNGIIHVIDEVLIPPTRTMSSAEKRAGGY